MFEDENGFAGSTGSDRSTKGCVSAPDHKHIVRS
jgi:hypothetical protein